MKIFLISAFLCLAGLTQAANVQRLARNTEAIIPTIVEEILKVELQSDLKKNSAVEAFEDEPIVKAIKDEVIVEPVASRIIEEVLAAEEKKPEIVEVVAIQEIVPDVAPATRSVEPVVEIIEKVEVAAVQENAEKPVDNFRTESVPAVDQVPEIVKEIVIVDEPVSEIRKEPEAVIMIKEEEIVQPMFRNVVKEEIPQVEALRNDPVEMDAVKDIIPEPVAAANIVEPVVEVEQKFKTIEIAPVKVEIIKEDEIVPAVSAFKAAPVVPEVPFVPEVPVEIKADAPVVAEIKEEKIEVAVIPEVKFVPEIKPAEVAAVPEAAPVLPESAAPIVDESDSQTRQERPTIVQAIQQNLANLPVVGQIFNRNPAIANDDAAPAEDGALIAEAPSAPVTSAPGPLQALVSGTQQFFSNVQTNAQNLVSNAQTFVANNLAPANNNADQPQNPIASFIQNVQNAISGPTTASSVVIKDESKPEKAGDKPAEEKPEAAKSVVEPEAQVVVDPVIVQKEVVEVQKIVEEEKENIVKV